jgi:hypothetical protein
MYGSPSGRLWPGVWRLARLMFAASLCALVWTIVLWGATDISWRAPALTLAATVTVARVGEVIRYQAACGRAVGLGPAMLTVAALWLAVGLLLTM